MDYDLITKIAQGGFAAGLLFLIYLVGNRLVRAIDKLVTKLDEHTKSDLEHHGYVRESVVELSTKVDLLFEHTPVETVPRRPKTYPRGVPAGTYGPMRPRTKNDGDE